MYYLHWFVLVIAGIDRIIHCFDKTTVTITMCLYPVAVSCWWVLSNTKKWERKLMATESKSLLTMFQIAEAANALPSAFASVYLIADSYVPVSVFFVCLFVSGCSQYKINRMWKAQMKLLDLGV